MSIHPSLTLERVTDAVHRNMMSLDNPGFCTECGAENDGCEPDAQNYKCEQCGQHAVMGAEMLLAVIF